MNAELGISSLGTCSHPGPTDNKNIHLGTTTDNKNTHQVLLQELRRHYRVDETVESALTQTQIDELNERGMSISRPLEAALAILRQLKREGIELSRMVHASHKARLRAGSMPWEFFEMFPMKASVAGSAASSRDPRTVSADATAESGAGDAEGTRDGPEVLLRKEFEWDEAQSVSLQLRAFLSEYHSSYVTERSLVAQVNRCVCVCAWCRSCARRKMPPVPPPRTSCKLTPLHWCIVATNACSLTPRLQDINPTSEARNPKP